MANCLMHSNKNLRNNFMCANIKYIETRYLKEFCGRIYS